MARLFADTADRPFAFVQPIGATTPGDHAEYPIVIVGDPQECAKHVALELFSAGPVAFKLFRAEPKQCEHALVPVAVDEFERLVARRQQKRAEPIARDE